MNAFFLFLMIFFGIVGIIKSVDILYAFFTRRLYLRNIKQQRNEKDVKTWMKY